MPRNRRRSRGSRRGGRGRRGDGGETDGTITETFTFSIGLGSSGTFTRSSATSLPTNRNFRPLHVRVSCTAAIVPIIANGDTPLGFAASAVQIELQDPSTHVVANSMPVVLGTAPRNVHTRYPPSADWFNFDSPANQVLMTISAICLGEVGGSRSAFLRGMGFIRFSVGPEISPSTCPAFTHIVSNDSPDSSRRSPLSAIVSAEDEASFVMTASSLHDAPG